MITYQTEKWQSFYVDFRKVWEKWHAREVQPDEVRDSSIDFEGYLSLEEQDKLLICTARDDRNESELIGYVVGVLQRYLNFNHVLSVPTLYYVLPLRRGKGIGTELFHFYELESILRRAEAIFVGVKTELPFEGFFAHRGYYAHETLYMKWI